MDVKNIITLAGGNAALAERLGVRRTTVWRWANRTYRIPDRYAVAVSRATGVPLHLVCPDVFSEEHELTELLARHKDREDRELLRILALAASVAGAR